MNALFRSGALLPGALLPGALLPGTLLPGIILPGALLLMILLSQCKPPDGKEESALQYFFLDELSADAEYFEQYSESDVAAFINEHPPDKPIADTMFVGDLQIFRPIDDYTEESDSILIAVLAFAYSDGTFFQKEDSIIGEAFQMQVMEGDLSILRRDYIRQQVPPPEPEEPVTTETDDPGTGHDRPSVWLDIWQAEGRLYAMDEVCYGLVNTAEIFAAIGDMEYSHAESVDTAYLTSLYIREASLVTFEEPGVYGEGPDADGSGEDDPGEGDPGEGDPGADGSGEDDCSPPAFKDSLLVVFFGYTTDTEGWGRTNEYTMYYDLFVLDYTGDELLPYADMYLGSTYETEEMGYSSIDHYYIELFHVTEDASAVAIYRSMEEGSEYGGQSTRWVDFYVPSEGMMIGVFHLDLQNNTYEADYQGPPEEHSSYSIRNESEFFITGELENGFYTIEVIETFQEHDNDELIRESSAKTYYIWSGGMYERRGGY